MFGSKKIQEFEAKISELQGKLDEERSENEELTQRLESASRRISELEDQLRDFDLERLKEEASASRAEYEGLKELYTRKNREFDDSREEAEQSFARESALKRHNLENEIRDNRKANQDYVSTTVKTFGESYNYYLNQIKLLMDALGDVATRTGEALFSGENDDLKARIASQMRDKLKLGKDTLPSDTGDLILIGSDEEAQEKAEEIVDAAEGLTDGLEQAAQDFGEAFEEASDEAGELFEEAAEDAEEAVEALEDDAEEAAEKAFE